MKNDLRITFPLWMMCFILLIAASIYFIGTTALIEGRGMDEFTFSISLESNLTFFAILFVLFNLVAYSPFSSSCLNIIENIPIKNFHHYI